MEQSYLMNKKYARKLIDNNNLPLVKSENMGRAKRIDDAGGRYIEYLKSRMPSSLRLMD